MEAFRIMCVYIYEFVISFYCKGPFLSYPFTRYPVIPFYARQMKGVMMFHPSFWPSVLLWLSF